MDNTNSFYFIKFFLATILSTVFPSNSNKLNKYSLIHTHNNNNKIKQTEKSSLNYARQKKYQIK